MAATVVFGGGPFDPGVVASVLATVDVGRVMAADSGLETCAAVGLHCDVAVGDMDSVDRAVLRAARAAGTELEVHPSDKDASDLELALDRATSEIDASGGTPGDGEPEVVVVASAGGRMDHLLSTAALVGSPRYAPWQVEAYLGATKVVPVHRRGRIHAPIGDTVSLLALHGEVCGVTATGLRWPLEDECLAPEVTRGVSNVVCAAPLEIDVGSGVLTVVLPRGRDDRTRL